MRELLPDSLEKLTLRCDLAAWEEYEWNVDAISAVFSEYLEEDKPKRLRNVVLWLMDQDYDDYFDGSLVLSGKLRKHEILMEVQWADRLPGGWEHSHQVFEYLNQPSLLRGRSDARTSSNSTSTDATPASIFHHKRTYMNFFRASSMVPT